MSPMVQTVNAYHTLGVRPKRCVGVFGKILYISGVFIVVGRRSSVVEFIEIYHFCATFSSSFVSYRHQFSMRLLFVFFFFIFIFIFIFVLTPLHEENHTFVLLDSITSYTANTMTVYVIFIFIRNLNFWRAAFTCFHFYFLSASRRQ